MSSVLTTGSPVTHVHLPLPLDVALPIVGFGLAVFLIVAYDMYRYAHAG